MRCFIQLHRGTFILLDQDYVIAILFLREITDFHSSWGDSSLFCRVGHEGNFHGHSGRRTDQVIGYLSYIYILLFSEWNGRHLGQFVIHYSVRFSPPPSQSYLFHISAFNGQSFLTPEFLFSKLFWLLMVPAPKEYQTWKVGYNAAPKLTPFICENKMLKERW